MRFYRFLYRLMFCRVQDFIYHYFWKCANKFIDIRIGSWFRALTLLQCDNCGKQLSQPGINILDKGGYLTHCWWLGKCPVCHGNLRPITDAEIEAFFQPLTEEERKGH